MIKKLLLTLLFAVPVFADVPLGTPVAVGKVTAVFQIYDPASASAPAVYVPLPFDQVTPPKVLTVIFWNYSPKTDLISTSVKYSCDGVTQASERGAVSSFLYPGPYSQSIPLCSGAVKILTVKITEYSALSSSDF